MPKINKPDKKIQEIKEKDGKQYFDKEVTISKKVFKDELEHEIDNYEKDEARLEIELVHIREKLAEFKEELNSFVN